MADAIDTTLGVPHVVVPIAQVGFFHSQLTHLLLLGNQGHPLELLQLSSHPLMQLESYRVLLPLLFFFLSSMAVEFKLDVGSHDPVQVCGGKAS